MVAQKLPGGQWVQFVAILAGNIVVIWAVLRMLDTHLRSEQIRTKRAFEPRSLIGTMQPVPPSGD
jgi:hypothetical protein